MVTLDPWSAIIDMLIWMSTDPFGAVSFNMYVFIQYIILSGLNIYYDT